MFMILSKYKEILIHIVTYNFILIAHFITFSTISCFRPQHIQILGFISMIHVCSSGTSTDIVCSRVQFSDCCVLFFFSSLSVFAPLEIRFFVLRIAFVHSFGIFRALFLPPRQCCCLLPFYFKLPSIASITIAFGFDSMPDCLRFFSLWPLLLLLLGCCSRCRRDAREMQECVQRPWHMRTFGERIATIWANYMYCHLAEILIPPTTTRATTKRRIHRFNLTLKCL